MAEQDRAKIQGTEKSNNEEKLHQSSVLNIFFSLENVGFYEHIT
jgi:hypothetical protein